MNGMKSIAILMMWVGVICAPAVGASKFTALSSEAQVGILDWFDNPLKGLKEHEYIESVSMVLDCSDSKRAVYLQHANGNMRQVQAAASIITYKGTEGSVEVYIESLKGAKVRELLAHIAAHMGEGMSLYFVKKRSQRSTPLGFTSHAYINGIGMGNGTQRQLIYEICKYDESYGLDNIGSFTPKNVTSPLSSTPLPLPISFWQWCIDDKRRLAGGVVLAGVAALMVAYKYYR